MPILAFFWCLITVAASAQKIQVDTLVGRTDSVFKTSMLERYKLPHYNNKYPVLYGTQQDSKSVESIGYLKGGKLTSTPTTFISNAFSGRIAGLYTEQFSGEPGNDAVSLTLRGLNPIVLVDGIPRPRAPYSINPEQIASITVLKDALSTAMLGIRGMNGAILITTRKGKEESGFNLDFTTQAGVSTPINLPDPLSAYNYARLYNEALTNDGKTPVYSQEDLDMYKNGIDPYGHPNVNWYDKTLKSQSPLSRYTLNAGGSNEVMHYFVSLDYLNQQGLFRQEPSINTYSTNTEYQRYIFRSNIDASLTPRLSVYLNLYGRVRNQNSPGGETTNIFDALLKTPNNAYPAMNPDSSLGGNVNFSNNIYGQSVLSGYRKVIYSDGYADLGFKRDMNDIFKGWWIKGALSYDLTLNQHIDRDKNFETFQMHINPATGDTTYQRYGSKSDQNNTSTVTTRDHQFYMQASTGYTHRWDDNMLDVLLSYDLDEYTFNSDLPDKYETFAGRVEYSIQDKYILEVATSYSGNNRYEPGNRYGFFPAAGVAWNMHNEHFFDEGGFINTLKLRASYGLTGNAVAGYYEYINHYVGSSDYFFGSAVSTAYGITENQPRDIHTFQKGLKMNIGMDMSFAGNRAMFSMDYYRNKLKDVVQARGNSSAVLGWGRNIYQNLGRDLYSGLEINAGWSDHAGSFGYFISGNLSFSDSEILYNDEPNYPYAWMQRTGHRVNQIYGYVADGFVTEPGEGPVVEGYTSVPGDLKYKDLNGDGVINQFDRQAIGTQSPLIFYGANVGFSWKKFSLNFLIQGVANRDILLTGSTEWAFQDNGEGQAYRYHMNRWTPETASSATYPRLSAGTNVNNNVVSSFWVRSGDYVRLKNVELSYTLNSFDLAKEINVKQLRFFVNGLNLLTASDFSQSDPEILPGAYPIQRVVNGGVSIKF